MLLLLLTGSYTLQDGATLRHRCHPTRRQNAQTEDEDGSSQPHVGRLCHCLPFFYYNQRFTWLMFFFYSSRFFDLFEKYGGYKTGKLKLKKPKQLQVTPSRPHRPRMSSSSCVNNWQLVSLNLVTGGAGHHTAVVSRTRTAQRLRDRREEVQTGAAENCSGNVSYK